MPFDVDQLPWKSSRAGDNEVLLWHTSRHFVRYIAPVTVAVLLSVVATLLFWMSVASRDASLAAAQAFCLAAVGVLAVLNHLFFHYVLSESICDIILTKKRVVYITHRLWLSDLMHDIALHQVKAVEAHQTGIVQHLLDYGEIWFDTGGSAAGESNQTIAYVPKPQKWATEISRAMKAL